MQKSWGSGRGDPVGVRVAVYVELNLLGVGGRGLVSSKVGGSG